MLATNKSRGNRCGNTPRRGCESRGRTLLAEQTVCRSRTAPAAANSDSHLPKPTNSPAADYNLQTAARILRCVLGPTYLPQRNYVAWA